MASFVARLARRVAYGRHIIVVSGLPRSGTSMMMRMLEAGGLPLLVDGVRQPDESNPHGYYEYERVKTLDTDPDKSWLRGARGKGLKVVSPLLKYLPATNNYKVIVMHRDLCEIVASQNRMLERAGLPTNEAGEERTRSVLEDDLRKTRYLLAHGSCFESLDVHYPDVLRDPIEHATRVAVFLGRDLLIASMALAVDVNLYRNRMPKDR